MFNNTLIASKQALNAVVILFASFIISACSSAPEKQLKERWIITSIAGQAVLKQHTPWVEFDTNFDTQEGHIKGHSGCNRFFARYKLKEGEIAFSPIGSTRKACPGPEMKQESALFKLLTTTMTLQSEGNIQLSFLYNEQAVLELEKEPIFTTPEPEDHKAD